MTRNASSEKTVAIADYTRLPPRLDFSIVRVEEDGRRSEKVPSLGENQGDLLIEIVWSQ